MTWFWTKLKAYAALSLKKVFTTLIFCWSTLFWILFLKYVYTPEIFAALKSLQSTIVWREKLVLLCHIFWLISSFFYWFLNLSLSMFNKIEDLQIFRALQYFNFTSLIWQSQIFHKILFDIRCNFVVEQIEESRTETERERNI